MSENDVCIEGRNLSYELNGKSILNRVNIKIRKGDQFGILGRKDSGKSTLLKVLFGRSSHWQGELFLLGGNAKSGLSKYRARIGVVPEVDDFEESLSCRENLDLFADFMKLPRARRDSKLWQVITEVNLEERSDHLARSLTPSERKRLSLARAILNDPEVLFIDEPTANLKEEHHTDFFQLLSKYNMTKVIASSSSHEISMLCDKVALLDSGRVLDVGNVADLVLKHVGGSVVEFQVDLDEVPYFQSRLADLSFTYKIYTDTIAVHLPNFAESGRLLSTLPLREHLVRSAQLEDVLVSLRESNDLV